MVQQQCHATNDTAGRHTTNNRQQQIVKTMAQRVETTTIQQTVGIDQLR